ncbi:MAG: universal stress protein [Acidobacteriia bacterium]|nr:universal stress protein [Terriglobia bacterium]
MITPYKIKKILFPVDFSERCVGAARYVEAFAGRFEAELRLLHVVDADVYGSEAHGLRGERQALLDTFLIKELGYCSAQRICVVGDPATEIVEAARSWTPDMIMMTTRGFGFYRPTLLGSVTAKVLHDVEFPVWTDIHSEDAPALEKISVRKVLCAIDLQKRSRQILDWAAFLACEYQAELAIVHAIPLVVAPPLLAEVRTKMNALLTEAGAKGTIMIDRGEPVEVTTGAAKEFGADLLIIGRHSGSGGKGYLRHNAYAILRKSICPVISL